MANTNNPLVDTSRVQLLMGDYGVANARALTNPFWHLMAQEHRRMLASHMAAFDKPTMKLKLPESDYFVSRKVDGEFSLLVVQSGSCCIVNPGGTVRVGLPFMAEAVKLLKDAKVDSAVFAGELYVARTDRRPRCHDVSRVARQPANADEVGTLRFAVFDILEIDQKKLSHRYADNWKQIEKYFKSGKGIHPVETHHVKTLADVEKHYETWVEGENAEGIVARSDVAGLYKIKPRSTLDVAVLGFTESNEPDRAGMMHDMLIGLMRPDETYQVLGRVGGGFTDDQRREFLSDLKDIPAESEYTEVNEQLAYQMVRPEWVIEISCLDLISQNTRGGSVDRMVLNWDNRAAKYGAVRRLPLASPISPQFLRKRQDKTPNPQDLRLQQVADIVEVPMIDRDARQLTLPGSTILKREVYTKQLKGQTMVRKLLLWKTNKHGDAGNGEWPAFVAYFTDFSPNRKTPLEREIRVSESQEQIEKLYEIMKTENIVKGWVDAVGSR
ncbi:ATP-dependent DNA ligase [Humisphaera borealis]|uniref:DNA ligase (ATP) n=1 Tax=Humisphaera borealis TaxID=2807512 RepID=A0A7M2X174_9BACT|nr:hypothetical protein [Humisphaera borealis]QOV91192.1 hypothetical protein IPV69_07480 [Humisphaera borealis]